MFILGLDEKVAEAMSDVFGDSIFKSKTYDGGDTVKVALSDYAILKYHGFDGSVRIDLGAKMFIMEKTEYWRIVIE